MVKSALNFLGVIILVFVLTEAVFLVFGLGSTTISNTLQSNYEYLQGTKVVNVTEGYSVRKVNNLGFLDRNYSTELRSNGLRFILLGNSFSEALQVPVNKTYENILEDSLSGQLHRPVEIWNLAHNGESLLDNMATSRIALHKIKYSYLLVQLNNANIMNTKESAENVHIINGVVSCDLDKLKKPTLHSRANQKLKEYSIIWNTLNARIRVFSRFISSLKPKQLFYIKNQKDGGGDISGRANSQVSQANKDYFQYLLSLFTAEINKDSARLIMFTYPVERNKDLITFYVESCKKNNAVYLDLSKYSELFDSTKYPMQGFINTKLGFGHMNVNGNSMLAQSLDKEILTIMNKNN